METCYTYSKVWYQITDNYLNHFHVSEMVSVFFLHKIYFHF